jgi:hypothetical protein
LCAAFIAIEALQVDDGRTHLFRKIRCLSCAQKLIPKLSDSVEVKGGLCESERVTGDALSPETGRKVHNVPRG